MKTAEIIILGAGAAGLMAARCLAKRGKRVLVIEARNRIGGRIYSFNDYKGFTHAEAGAEFVHGNLPVTLGLLNEAGIETSAVDFEMWQHQDGGIVQSNEFVTHWEDFLSAVNKLPEDMPLQEVLDRHFADEKYARTRIQVKNYVAGYDTADVNQSGTFALRNEWNHEDEDGQHRVSGGYGSLIDFLAQECRDAGAEILLNVVAHEVHWHKGAVSIITGNGKIFQAAKAIIALPLGILQAREGFGPEIRFSPTLPAQDEAFANIGFGSVIKILLEFEDAFWASDTIAKQVGADLATMGFLFSGEAITTFWTQAPANTPLLTGWIGGPPAQDIKELSEGALLDVTLESLSRVFKMEKSALQEKLKAWHVANWTTDPYTRGSYAYDKVESPAARRVLAAPVEDTLYFAGEYLYEGPAIGTVEAALTSGKNAAQLLLDDDVSTMP